MKSKCFVRTAVVLGLSIAGMGVSFGQAPTTLRLTSKVRDFQELPDARLPSSIPTYHPDFNTFGGCPATGYVDAVIQTNGTMDTAIFPNDNRNPKLINAQAGCFTSTARFDEWYNDRDVTVNRPFLYDLVFQRNGAGMYEYVNSNFFPLDNDSLPRIDPATGKPITRSIPGGPTTTFGHENTGGNAAHDFGFTMEFHANFTYIASTDPAKQQVFTFTGDDDVWVFFNGKLAIDLGGVHSALTKTITLDAAQETALGLTNGQSYLLDFFIAERHITQSNCRITTSLVLETQKVARPTANPPGKAFDSQVSIVLSTATPGATIYYTVNGSTPDSTSLAYDPTKPIVITGTTTIKAIAYRAGWQKSDVMSETYTKNFTLSSLDILDQNGNPLSGGYLTELNTAYTVKVTTTQAGFTTLTANATTKVAADAETVILSNPVNQGVNLVFSGTSPLLITTAAIGNNKTEASSYDSLIVRWVNPTDPTRDIAEKRILVRPAPKQARAYFSTKADGSDTTDTYAGTETTLYLFVIDEILPSGQTPKVTLETTPKNGPGRTKDTETLNMVTVSPGKYRATIPVEINPTSAAGDGKLQLALEDAILATYKDPTDGDVATANAGYGIAPDITAELQFTDKNGAVLPAGTYYSPAEGALYLTYKDDWVNGSIATKSVTMTITNNGGKAPGDAETFTIPLVPSKKAGSVGVWEGSIKLEDHPNITSGNGIAETYILGEVHAVVASHNKVGTGPGPGPVTDDLLVAYANKDAIVTIEGKDPGVEPTRKDSILRVIVKDQSISSAIDTLYSTLSCSESKDVVVNVMLIETSATSGIYQSTIISKTEGAVVSDGVLQCNSTDIIKATYKDPVYQDTKVVQVLIESPVTTRIYFSSKADGSDEITSVNDLDADAFYVVVVARSPDVSKVDNLPVTFTTAQGETETFTAVETGPYTEKFIAKVPFGFVSSGGVTANNGTLEGKITPKEANNLVTATGSVTVEGKTSKGSIDLVAAFAPVEKAYIKDTDGDGLADKVYIVFEKRLGRLPTTVIAQWNTDVSVEKPAGGAKISFLNADSNVVVIDYKGAFTEPGKTSITVGQEPRATLPDDALFKGQKPIIQDSIGPIIVSAIKKPSNVNTAVANDPNFNLDTIVVVLSEPLKNADFKEKLKFSTSCDDYAHAKIITAVQDPPINPLNPNEYTIVVDKSNQATPSAGNCVFLNADPDKYTDIPGNKPPQYGVELKGADGKTIIQVFRGFPPVAGLDPNNPTFQVAVQDSRDPSKQGFATPAGPTASQWQVVWIPPAGFTGSDDDWSYNPNPVPSINDMPSGSKEGATPLNLPRNISAIQVVSTTAYIARISIFDIYGNFVRSSVQAFGAAGELQNQARVVPKGLVSFLIWDMKDSKGQLAGNGVYVWKVQFEFKGGKQEVQYTRTGVMRKNK